MAKEDKYEPVTAQDVMAVHGDALEGEDKERAAKAGVVGVEYVNYEGALENYEGREDVEPLAERRARESGTSFHDAKFRREVGKGSDAVTTSNAVKNK